MSDPAISGAVLTWRMVQKCPGIFRVAGSQAGSATVVKKMVDTVQFENITVTDFVRSIISTPYGRQCSLVLPDGSSVYLNAGSSLTFR